MITKRKTKQIIELGDFQTPPQLAGEICRLLAEKGISPASILEPTCGKGNFLFAALSQFPRTRKAFGIELNPEHYRAAKQELLRKPFAGKAHIINGSFFYMDWKTIIAGFPEPILVVGNPPWVTNSELESLGSSNLPDKENFQGHNGLDAITGKSNFDISEWMMLKMVDSLNGYGATIALLCKTSVARKVLLHAWKTRIGLQRGEMYIIDAMKHFNAAVEACLLVLQFGEVDAGMTCSIFRDLHDTEPETTITYRSGTLISDLKTYNRWKHLEGTSPFKWRSGVKHDCSKVMELRKETGGYRNGLGEVVDIEDTFVYPMMKSSDLASRNKIIPRRWMIVTQKRVGDDTDIIREQAPKTWDYLESHAALLDRRGSSIYQKRPRFAVFGIGPYTFAPHKVAISGFYKNLSFKKIGSYEGKPIVLDDTCYFLPCRNQHQADCLWTLLNSGPAREFFSAYVFWDSKRPITVTLLQRLDIVALAAELGLEQDIVQYIPENVRRKQASPTKTLFSALK